MRTKIDATSVYDTQLSLMTRTHTLVRDRDLLAIHRQTNIPYHWLCRFSAGKIRNPSVNRIQYLYEQLTGKNLLKR